MPEHNVSTLPFIYINRSFTVIVLNETVEENTSHGNSVTREVRVIVHTITNLEARRGVAVTGKEREYIVLCDPLSINGLQHVLKAHLRDHRDEP